MSITDHGTDIRAAAAAELEYLTEDGDAFDNLDAWALEVTVFKSDNDQYRVEFLTGCGGPTTRWTVDSRYGVTYEHSWGRAVDGSEQTALDAWALDTSELEALAESLASF